VKRTSKQPRTRCLFRDAQFSREMCLTDVKRNYSVSLILPPAGLILRHRGEVRDTEVDPEPITGFRQSPCVAFTPTIRSVLMKLISILPVVHPVQNIYRWETVLSGPPAVIPHYQAGAGHSFMAELKGPQCSVLRKEWICTRKMAHCLSLATFWEFFLA